jgi:hypothetical protein
MQLGQHFIICLIRIALILASKRIKSFLKTVFKFISNEIYLTLTYFILSKLLGNTFYWKLLIDIIFQMMICLNFKIA